LSDFIDWTHKLFVIDENNYWVIGESVIHNTQNGGLTWNNSDPFDGVVTTDIYFTDILNGWATDFISNNKSNIYHTSNEGQSWEKQYTGEGEFLPSIFFYDQHTGWAVGRSGDSGVIINTINDGITWENQLYVNDLLFMKVRFTSLNNGVVVGYHGTVFQTDDGGESWNQINDGIDIEISDVFFVGQDYIWIIGSRGQYPQPVTEGLIYNSTDGGHTWIEQSSGTSSELLSIWFNDMEMGWIAGEKGTILYTNNGGVGVKENSLPINQNTLLIFPNPTPSHTTFSFELQENNYISISLYTINGQRAKHIFSGEKNIGEHQFEIDCSNLSMGIYFLRLQYGKDVVTQKLIVN